jgi:ABC-type uncharacterized transport system ATPase subunit
MPRQPGSPLVEVRDLVREFGGVRAVDGLSFILEDGAMLAVIGPNGCGKTTLFNMMTGVLRPSSGEILFDGHSIDGLSPVAIARQGLVRKFQVPSIFPGLSVAGNMDVACSVSGIPAAEAVRMLEMVGLLEETGQLAGTLSHGQKQWLELALVLAVKPRLVLLDEPAAGMTRAEKQKTIDMLARLRAAMSLSLVVIEHDMHFIEALNCPVKAMMRGRFVAEGDFDAVRRDPILRDGYLGRRAGVG